MRSRAYPLALLLALGAAPSEAREAARAAPSVAATPAPAVPAPAAGMKRFMVVRTFGAGELDGLDAAAKKQVNTVNASHSVKWVRSFANSDKTKTFCIYDGPNAQAVRDAARSNKIPVDDIFEVPVVLLPR